MQRSGRIVDIILKEKSKRDLVGISELMKWKVSRGLPRALY